MTDFHDWNRQVIDEFRANRGRVGGQFEGASLLLLHHVGAKSGTERVTPVMYEQVGTSYAVFASKAGADTNPAWYHNVRAHPHVSIETGTDLVAVRARELGADERDPIWQRQKERYPGFAEYEQRTRRIIPVLLLESITR